MPLTVGSKLKPAVRLAYDCSHRLIGQTFRGLLIQKVMDRFFYINFGRDILGDKTVKRGFVGPIGLAPRREHTSKALRYGTRSQGISGSWYSCTDPVGMEG